MKPKEYDMNKIKISRVWAMPNKWTFQIKPIRELLNRYVKDGTGWIDPFAGMNSPAEYTNDLNPDSNAKYHLDAIDFLDEMNGIQVQGVLFDPPYSLRQIMECYESFGKSIDKKWATTRFHADIKTKLGQKVVPGGYAICCGWNSIGLGKNRGFNLIEILLVSHGRAHNDTIITVERKLNATLTEDWRC